MWQLKGLFVVNQARNTFKNHSWHLKSHKVDFWNNFFELNAQKSFTNDNVCKLYNIVSSLNGVWSVYSKFTIHCSCTHSFNTLLSSEENFSGSLGTSPSTILYMTAIKLFPSKAWVKVHISYKIQPIDLWKTTSLS